MAEGGGTHVENKKIILNKLLEGESLPESTISLEELGVKLQKSMLTIKGKFLAEDGHCVKYDLLKVSQEFKDYVELAKLLNVADLDKATSQQRKAFFINIYNALTIHGLANCETLPSSVLQISGFWRNSCYNIGGLVFSLDDIEHGILRCNKPHPSTGLCSFKESDPRLKYMMKVLDLRIHFALVCGAKSCPPIQVYTGDKVDHNLGNATSNFIHSEVVVDEAQQTITLSQIFEWYAEDFAPSTDDLLRWLSMYMLKDQGDALKRLMAANTLTVKYDNYNWMLNKW